MARSITLIPVITEETNNEVTQVIKKRVAAYCRVSTDQEMQLNSFEAQTRFYREKIEANPEYELAGIYADEGISGTSTKNRDQFNKMIDDCKAGKIDMVISKSISRFSRNTLDCLNYVRLLKGLGIGVLFEKEGINTLDSTGETLLTILSSLAQEESLSLSLNSTWGVRRRFEQGKVTINEKKFLGYEKDSEGNLIINNKQATIVKRIYKDFLDGKGAAHITRELEEEKVINWNGTAKWYESTIKSILQNEKYKGEALLQKSYTVDFLTKKRVKNMGDVPQYYVQESHPAIIDPETWEAVQLEIERRKSFCEQHNIKKLDTRIPFWGKVICGECGSAYSRKTWMQPDGSKRKVWMCSNRYKTKGVKGCESKHIDEAELKKAFVEVFNELVANKQYFLEKWRDALEDRDALKQYRLNEFIGILESSTRINTFDEDLCLEMLKHIQVVDGMNKLVVVLGDG